MSNVLRKIREVLSYAPASGVASPKDRVFFDTSCIPLADVMKLYDRDPTCKSSVDLLAASTVGMGFYTTVDAKYEKSAEAKAAVDRFCEDVNLDGLLNDMAKPLIACGNDFWLKLTPERLADTLRMPIDSVQRIGLSSVPTLKIPYKVTGYQLQAIYSGNAGNELKPEAVIHWRLNGDVPSGFGVGLLQVLLHTLTVDTDKRPSYAWMKAKIEKILPNIFVKYAGPDVVVQLEGQKEDTIKKYESAIKNRPEEGQWLFSGAKSVGVYPVSIDPRARFEYYIDHMVNQFYLGCETPLPRLFSTPGFTEASARAALDLQDMLIKPVQRYIKRQVEKEIFAVTVSQAGLDAAKAKVRLNFGSPETPELVPSDLIRAAELGLVRAEEFRKNAVKFGWELWDVKQSNSTAPEGDT
ncbi:MAG: hypothetical protein QM398_03225 [Thermoproteota archaeon]|jgi:hypothetical protein|nr:hypothetical protein [Thermoproteota archaeon]